MSNYLRYNQNVNYTLYYNALDYFQTIMTNHPQISKATTGDIQDVDEVIANLYP